MITYKTPQTDLSHEMRRKLIHLTPPSIGFFFSYDERVESAFFLRRKMTRASANRVRIFFLNHLSSQTAIF